MKYAYLYHLSNYELQLVIDNLLVRIKLACNAEQLALRQELREVNAIIDSIDARKVA